MIRAAVPALIAALLALPAWATAQVPPKGQAKPAAKAVAGRIDLNSATAEELETLPGVGPALSKKIIDGRPYKAIDDLKAAGINDATIDKIRDQVTVKAVETKKAETKKADAKKAEAARPAAGALVDINNAKADELETLPGIGAATAQAIIDARPFKTVDDLERVKGLGAAKIAAIKDQVKAGPVAEPKAKTAAKPAPAPAPAETKAAAKEKAKTEAKTAAPAAGKKVNINTASKEELDALPGIGPVKAQAILDARPFKTLESLKDVKGIGDVTFENLKDLITIR